MSEGLNRVFLLGGLTADPDLRFGQGPDSATLKIRLATTESYFDRRTNERKERTDYHSVVVFGKRAEGLQKILVKGSQIMVEGRLSTRSYEKNGQKMYATDVVATNVILAGGKRAEGQSPTTGPRPNEPRKRPEFGSNATHDRPTGKGVVDSFDDPMSEYADDDDSIPF